MPICGGKRDVDKKHTGAHKEVRATKIYGADDTEQTFEDTKKFTAIRDHGIKDQGKQTKDEGYAREDNHGSKSRLLTKKEQLNFDLDEENGVAQTFDIPTFDYQTILSHSYFLGKNSKQQIVQNDQRLAASFDGNKHRDASGLWF